MKRIFKSLLILILVLLVSIPVFAIDNDTSIFDDFKEIEKEKLISIIDNKEMSKVIRSSNNERLYFITSNGEKYWFKDEVGDITSYILLTDIEIESASVLTTKEHKEKKSEESISNIVMIIIFGSVGLLFLTAGIIQKRKAAVAVGNIHSSTGEKETIPDIKFSDVEGIEGLKSDVMRVVDSLKNPEKYKMMGARPTKGIILYGPPGTGKTLLAKAIAGEAGVPFFSAVGSDFVEKYVGVGASRVRELYKRARKVAPCIVFIDEVDAVAAQRGQDNNSEADQTINALLSELDGFSLSNGVVTICATNRLDLLDSAFKRAGRFDLKLAVGLPDKKGRTKILKIHGANKNFSEDIDFERIADKTVGFSGADLESLLNEAALIAVEKNNESITYEDIDDAFFKIVMQGNKKKREEIDETTKVIAWHEAGHTLATKLLTNDSVPSVTIIGSTSGAGGVTFRNPEETMLQSKKYLENTIKIMYAGRAAEQIYFLHDDDKITTGASQDIRQATQILREYLGYYGMGESGMIDITQFENGTDIIMNESTKKAKILYAQTVSLLDSHADILEKLAQELIDKETLYEEEINKIIFENK